MKHHDFIFKFASNPFSTRGGFNKYSATPVSHVTPSPRVPAADILSLDSPHQALISGGLILEGSEPEQRVVNVLPHVTPSPRVPANHGTRVSSPR